MAANHIDRYIVVKNNSFKSAFGDYFSVYDLSENVFLREEELDDPKRSLTGFSKDIVQRRADRLNKEHRIYLKAIIRYSGRALADI